MSEKTDLIDQLCNFPPLSENATLTTSEVLEPLSADRGLSEPTSRPSRGCPKGRSDFDYANQRVIADEVLRVI